MTRIWILPYIFDKKSSFFYINCSQSSSSKASLIFYIKFLIEKITAFSLSTTHPNFDNTSGISIQGKGKATNWSSLSEGY